MIERHTRDHTAAMAQEMQIRALAGELATPLYGQGAIPA